MTESEEFYAFFHYVGLALAKWAFVEMQLEGIAANCSSEGRIGYRSIENFRSKVAFVDALVRHKHVGDADLIMSWSKLQRSVLALSSKRNEIVHRVAVDSLNERGSVRQAGSRFALLDFDQYLSPNDLFLDKTRIQRGIKIKDLAERVEEFAALTVRLHNFDMSLGLPPSGRPYEGLPLPPVHRPTLREIEARMREALGRQPRPPRK